MGPSDSVDLQELRERKEQEERRLREHNVALSLEVERLKEEKIALRKKIVDQALALSAVADKKPADKKSSSSVSPQQQRPSDVSELRHRVSQLEDLLHSEQQRKEACQKEIARLSRELHSRGEDSKQHRVRQGGTEATDGQAEEEKRGLMSQLAEVRAQKAELHNRLRSMEEQKRSMARELEQKTAENESLHIKGASMTSTPLHIASTATSTPLHLLLHMPGDVRHSHGPQTPNWAYTMCLQ